MAMSGITLGPRVWSWGGSGFGRGIEEGASTMRKPALGQQPFACGCL